MDLIDSPFLDSINECKLTMRKLRKKIHKKCSNPNSNPNKKHKDNNEEIIHIFRNRNIPSFVTDTLRKRRNFDINSIKNIIINTELPLEDIRNRVNIQEQEINNLYSDHKSRMQELRQKAEEEKAARITSFESAQDHIYSSTNEDQGLQSMDHQFSLRINQENEPSFYQHFEQQSKDPIFTDNYLHLNESSYHSGFPLFNF